jgi:arylsulfatase A-like enzyme
MKSKKPNLLWLFCDQLRSHALSCNGDPNVKTPHIDRLAREGVNFTHACSQYPVCMPFRAGLVTGQHAHQNGVRVHGDMLPTDKKTIAHTFRDAGYRTSWVGKWHLASANNAQGVGYDHWVHPYCRGGFEDWFGFELSNHYYKTYYCSGESIRPIELKGYQTDALTNLSLEYLEGITRKSNQPWFHCLSVEAPHPGTDEDGSKGNPAPAEYRARFDPNRIEIRKNIPLNIESKARVQQAGYCAQIENLDDNIGRVLKWLNESGEAENTIVVFFSDHGEMGGSHGLFHKQLAYDESIRIPLIMRYPNVIPEKLVIDQPLSGIDIYPTCAGLSGIDIPSSVQGKDFSKVARGEQNENSSETLIQWLGQSRYGWGDFQYRAIRTRRYTYCVGTDSTRSMLFDNENDEFQLHNLFGSSDVRKLQTQLHQRLIHQINQSREPVPNFVESLCI